MQQAKMDEHFRCNVLSCTQNPEKLIYLAMHQDYSEDYVAEENIDLNREEMVDIIVNRLLKGNRGHYGPLEHPSITFNVGYFPHSVMQQARTHRVGVSFDVQSFRYTGKRVCDVANSKRGVEEVFYIRPTGEYTNRQGQKYKITEAQRKEHLTEMYMCAVNYTNRITQGIAEEHARSLLPFDVRQHFVVTFNLRSLMHFLDLRAKADAQYEIQCLCELMMIAFESWTPEIAQWYKDNRWKKARLAP